MSQVEPASHNPSEAHEHYPRPAPTGGEDELGTWVKAHKGAVVGIVAGAALALYLFHRHTSGSLFGSGASGAGGTGAGTSGEVTGAGGGLPPDSSLPPGTLYPGTLPPGSAPSQPGGTTNIYVITGSPTGGTPPPPGWPPSPYPVAPTPPPPLPSVKVVARQKPSPKPAVTRTVPPINPATGSAG
jgi:hypothetical protein